MRFKVTVTELVPVPGSPQEFGPANDSQPIFQQVVDFKPNLAKIVAALTPPRIRKPRSAKA